MAFKTWTEVTSSPEYKSLTPQDRRAARDSYFENVAAPQIPPQDVNSFKSHFYGVTDRDLELEDYKESLNGGIGSSVNDLGDTENAGYGAIPAYAPGMGFISSMEKGARRVAQTGESLGLAAAESALQTQREIAARSGDSSMLSRIPSMEQEVSSERQDIINQQNAINALPEHPTMGRVVGAANEAKGFLPTLQAAYGELKQSPDKLGLLTDFTAEQIPNMAATAGVAAATGGLGAIPSMAIGGGIGSAASTFGPNVAEGIEKGLSNEEALTRGFKQSGTQALVDAATGALSPVNIGGRELVNIPVQMAAQAAGGAGGEYLSRKAIGEDASKGELLVEGLGELVGAPGEIVQGASKAATESNSNISTTPQESLNQDDFSLEDFIESPSKASPQNTQLPQQSASTQPSMAEIEAVLNTDTPIDQIIAEADLVNPLPDEEEISIDSGEGTEESGRAFYNPITGSVRYPGQAVTPVIPSTSQKVDLAAKASSFVS